MKRDGSSHETSVTLLSNKSFGYEDSRSKCKSSPLLQEKSTKTSSKHSWNCIKSSSTTSLDQMTTQEMHKSNTSLQVFPTIRRSSEQHQSPTHARQQMTEPLLLPAAALSRKSSEEGWHAGNECDDDEEEVDVSRDSGLDYEAGPQTSSPTEDSASDGSHKVRLFSSSTESSVQMDSESLNDGEMVAQENLPKSAEPSELVSTSASSHRGSGAKYKLIHEGEISVCRLNHARTLISKILSSKYLRRWETHRLILGPKQMYSKQPNGFMENSICYAEVEEIHEIHRWDSCGKYCIRVVIPDGSLLLQVSNMYTREQWLHSLNWKCSFFKYQKMLASSARADVVIKEVRSMTELVSSTPLQDEVIYQTPLDLISDYISHHILPHNRLDTNLIQQMIVALAPLLENTHPTADISELYSRFCKECPRSSLLIEYMTPVVRRILKHSMSFGNNPKMRLLIQDYFLALHSHNDGRQAVKDFVHNMHGGASTCPHPRVLPNLVSVSVSAVQFLFEDQTSTYDDKNEVLRSGQEFDSRLACFIGLFQEMSTFEDWRLSLAQLLQPIPFPQEAIANESFTEQFAVVLRNIGVDGRCEVHSCVLPVRDNKDGWLHLYAPGGAASNFHEVEGSLFSDIMQCLINCCCRRKTFLTSQLHYIRAPCLLMALREDPACQEVLLAMLEMDVEKDRDYQLQMISTLQSTSSGKHKYAALCERQIVLRELQQRGGPRKLTLPSKSTDADLAKLLSSGSFGNLECLSLAFTQVTSACAECLIKLPSLKYLNLWSTQFGDVGLILVSEHLQKLQVLNLCETAVSDKGLYHLINLKHLKKLNLNSTQLTAATFETLKESLPALIECDVRYTDAW